MADESECQEIWTTREGKEIKVCDMSEAHVRNTLNMILRNRRETSEMIIEMLETLNEAIQEEHKKHMH